MSDFDAFLDDEGSEPPDGDHNARLDRAVLRDTRSGKMIKLEWRTTDHSHWWESWHGTSGGGKGRTQQLLEDLGVDRTRLKGRGWDALEEELADREDKIYLVNVSRNGTFLNTTVIEESQGEQTEIPVDTSDFAERAPTPARAGAADGSAASDLFGDDDIPF